MSVSPTTRGASQGAAPRNSAAGVGKPPLLEIRDLWVEFQRPAGTVHAVSGVNLQVAAGESLGIVGESGSGKSVSMLAVLGLVAGRSARVRGEAYLGGQDLLKLEPEALRRVRGQEVGVIFQDPMTSLNPVMPIGRQITESLLVRKLCSKREAKARAVDLLGRVGIPEPEARLRDFPHQFSGGMRQRVMIAIALALGPKLLIADEPTTALDVTIQTQVLKLLSSLRQEREMGLILITHDFGVATNYCDRVAVMYAGEIVELTTVAELVSNTAHPYALGLLESTMEIGHGKAAIEPILGTPPSALTVHTHCPFAPRCRFHTARCFSEKPPLRALEPGTSPIQQANAQLEHPSEHPPEHWVACHHAEEVTRHVSRQIPA